MNTKTPPSLKAKAQQRGLDPKVVDLADKADAALKSGLAAADQAIKVGIDKAGTAAVEHRDKVDEFLDKAVQTINEKTGGKYATQIDTVRSQVAKGVDKLAESAVAQAAIGAADGHSQRAPGRAARCDAGQQGQGHA